MPSGLLAAALILTICAGVMILAGDVASIAAAALIAILSLSFTAARRHAAPVEISPDESTFDLLLAAELSPAQIEVPPGSVLVPVRNPHLLALTPAERAVARTLLGYPENSVGRLMTPHYVAVRQQWTVREVLDYVRAHGQDSETLNVIYVGDERGLLVDDVRIREFLLAPLDSKVADLMDRRFVALTATDDQETAVAIAVGNAQRIAAAVPVEAPRVRSGGLVSAVCGDARRRDRTGDLLLGRPRRAARHAAVGTLSGGRVDETSLFTEFWTKESKTTSKVLSRIPEGSDYRPDPKSRTAREIAWQIVGEGKMIIEALETGKVEWAPGSPPATMTELCATFTLKFKG